MSAGGVQFGAHTRTHARLPELAPDAASGEVAASRADLARILGAPPTTFSFPYGAWAAESVHTVRDASFGGAFTTRSRPSYADGRVLLADRIEASGLESLRTFVRRQRRGGERP